MTDQKEISPKKKRSLVAVFFNLVVYAFIFLVIAFLLITLLLQLPAVQNWAIHKVTDRISNNIEGDVSVGRVNVAFMDGLVIEDIVIRDLDQDTIFTSGQISSSFNKSIFGMLQDGIDLDDFIWKDGKLHLVKKRGDDKFNLEDLLEPILNTKDDDDPNKKPKPFNLNALDLQNVEITILDEAGQLLVSTFI